MIFWVEVLPAAKFFGSRHGKFGVIFTNIRRMHVVKDFVPTLGTGSSGIEPSVKPQKGNGEFSGILVGELSDGHDFFG